MIPASFRLSQKHPQSASLHLTTSLDGHTFLQQIAGPQPSRITSVVEQPFESESSEESLTDKDFNEIETATLPKSHILKSTVAEEKELFREQAHKLSFFRTAKQDTQSRFQGPASPQSAFFQHCCQQNVVPEPLLAKIRPPFLMLYKFFVSEKQAIGLAKFLQSSPEKCSKVVIGKNGLRDAALAALLRALEDHKATDITLGDNQVGPQAASALQLNLDPLIRLSVLSVQKPRHILQVVSKLKESPNLIALTLENVSINEPPLIEALLTFLKFGRTQDYLEHLNLANSLKK